ncbi:MAG: radical SAM family heme chaperone HemW [Prevotella sp.]|nr:radical SAM family heme chaperone HemW [Prevotella sp.]
MSGIYVHIPFCKSRCTYCGFYSTTFMEQRQRYVDALCREYDMRRNYITLPPTTIYIGGGTPSVLTESQLEQLFSTLGNIASQRRISQPVEVTLECNPDDVTESFAALLRRLPVNRASMGAQTFNDERLRFLHRRHTSQQVALAVDRLRHAGIDNISVDLIYGFPGQTLKEWEADVDKALALHVEHLSAYALTYEEGTPLHHLLQQGRVHPIDEEQSRAMYYSLLDRTAAAGFEHYEISNFSLPGRRSRHNSGYWNQTPYLGLGAAAHSFDGKSRKWNVSDIMLYMEGVESGHLNYEGETLDADTRYNELVMTALRTSDGLFLHLLSPAQRSYCLHMASRYLDSGLLTHDKEKDRLRLARDGLFVSDMVIADLMVIA